MQKKGCLHQSSSYSSIILATLREHCALAFIDTMDNLVQISENEEPSLSNVLFSARADLYPEYSDYPDYNEFLYEQTYDDNDLEF